MRKALFFLPAILVFPLFFYSCGGFDFSKETATLDSLRKEVIRIETSLGAMDSVRLDSISIEASNNINRLKKVYDTDTVNMEQARKVTTYKSLRKLANKARSERMKLWSEIAYTKNQLDRLIEDLNNSRFDEPTGKKYFNEEKMATLSLLGAYDSYVMNIEWSEDIYDSINPIVKQMIIEKELERAAKK